MKKKDQDKVPARHRVSYWQTTDKGIRHLFFIVGPKVQISIEGRYEESAPGVPKKLDTKSKGSEFCQYVYRTCDLPAAEKERERVVVKAAMAWFRDLVENPSDRPMNSFEQAIVVACHRLEQVQTDIKEWDRK